MMRDRHIGNWDPANKVGYEMWGKVVCTRRRAKLGTGASQVLGTEPRLGEELVLKEVQAHRQDRTRHCWRSIGVGRWHCRGWQRWRLRESSVRSSQEGFIGKAERLPGQDLVHTFRVVKKPGGVEHVAKALDNLAPELHRQGCGEWRLARELLSMRIQINGRRVRLHQRQLGSCFLCCAARRPRHYAVFCWHTSTTS